MESAIAKYDHVVQCLRQLKQIYRNAEMSETVLSPHTVSFTRSGLYVSSYAIYKSCLKWQSFFRVIWWKLKPAGPSRDCVQTAACGQRHCPNAVFTLDLLVWVQTWVCLSSFSEPCYIFLLVQGTFRYRWGKHETNNCCKYGAMNEPKFLQLQLTGCSHI